MPRLPPQMVDGKLLHRQPRGEGRFPLESVEISLLERETLVALRRLHCITSEVLRGGLACVAECGVRFDWIVLVTIRWRSFAASPMKGEMFILAGSEGWIVRCEEPLAWYFMEERK